MLQLTSLSQWSPDARVVALTSALVARAVLFRFSSDKDSCVAGSLNFLSVYLL